MYLLHRNLFFHRSFKKSYAALRAFFKLSRQLKLHPKNFQRIIKFIFLVE
jgi:hypothetical protein